MTNPLNRDNHQQPGDDPGDRASGLINRRQMLAGTAALTALAVAGRGNSQNAPQSPPPTQPNPTKSEVTMVTMKQARMSGKRALLE